jgi:hypothetical protein
MAMENCPEDLLFSFFFSRIWENAHLLLRVLTKITAVTRENGGVYALVGGHDFCHVHQWRIRL